MNKQRSSQITTLIWQKTALVLLGLILSLVLLEGGMRLGGFVLLSIQEYGNLQSIKQKGTYRILCLGESTTERAYPRLLELVLNQRNIGVRFSVIDKGRSGTRTSDIVNRVESFLAEYHPDMIVTMMGINDVGSHMPLKALTTSEGAPFIKLRTYYLARLLWLHILTKAKEMGFQISAGDKRISVKAETPPPETGVKETSTEPILADASFKKIGEPDHENDNACVALGRLHKEQGKFSEAEDLFKKALLQNPENDKAYAELGKLYKADHKFSEAEASFKNAIRLNPGDGYSFFELGLLYRMQGMPVQAEDIFNKAIALNPKNAHLELGRLFREQGRFAEGEDSFKRILTLDPENGNAYFELGQLYRAQDKFHQAEDSLKKAIEFNPQNERELGAMASLYEAMGKPELEKEYAEKATLSSGYYFAFTANNYQKLKEILDSKGIKLVCVQYPMRNVEPLKKIFKKNEGVVFVDNERVFKEAVRRGGYKEYFRDMFAGDFGHCTPQGNELLAQNIAAVILREVFDKQ